MGSGARHGRRRAGRARRNRRRRARQHHHHHNRTNRAQAHHHHRAHMSIFLGAMARGRTQASRNVLYNTNSQSSNQGARVTTPWFNANDAYAGSYNSSSSASASTALQTPNSSSMQYFSVCRVFSIFLWFVGIMMMSLGGFQTPIGFIGLGLLFLGIVFLVLTSLLMSGSCSNYCYGTTDPERQQTRASTTTQRTELGNSSSSSGFTPSSATRYQDPVPPYASPDPTADKPPSYEEVMAGRNSSAVSTSILPTIMEADVPPSAPPSAELPSPVEDESNVPISPPNNLPSQNLGWSAAEPYPPCDPQTFHFGSGTNYSVASAFPSSHLREPTAPPSDMQDGSVCETEVMQSHSPSEHTIEVSDQPSGDSIRTHVDPSTQVDTSVVTTPLGTPIPSEESLPCVQVETLHNSPIPCTDTQGGTPLSNEPFHLLNSNGLSPQAATETSFAAEQSDRDIPSDSGTRNEQSPVILNHPEISNGTIVNMAAQSDC